MRHWERGGKFIFGGHKQLFTISGAAAVTSLAGIYLLVPPTTTPLPSLTPHPSSLITESEARQLQIDALSAEETAALLSLPESDLTDKLIINDQEVALPQQGTVRKSLSTDNGQTLTISVNGYNTGNSGSSSRNLNISSQSSSYSEIVEYDEHSPPF